MLEPIRVNWGYGDWSVVTNFGLGVLVFSGIGFGVLCLGLVGVLLVLGSRWEFYMSRCACKVELTYFLGISESGVCFVHELRLFP